MQSWDAGRQAVWKGCSIEGLCRVKNLGPFSVM